ncbi:B-box zinc finger protein 22-like [Actinidia eriantha]|uniref:B-box zinc finger protein 22-like n=1 Tax=Actinidia eriantha TaxID=165200 RepID=UPI00258468E0|nr:B-box zinc finger protein 22-like [Actinidia eriantha]
MDMKFGYKETIGYFFWLEDRALLCRKCDVAIHTGSSCVSGHQRFLLTGVKVGLEATELGGFSSKGSLNKAEKFSSPRALPGRGDVIPSTGQFNEAASGNSNAGGSRPNRIPEWHLEEYYGSTSNLYESSEKRPKEFK